MTKQEAVAEKLLQIGAVQLKPEVNYIYDCCFFA